MVDLGDNIEEGDGERTGEGLLEAAICNLFNRSQNKRNSNVLLLK